MQGVVTGIGLQRPVYSPSAALAVVQPAECQWWPECEAPSNISHLFNWRDVAERRAVPLRRLSLLLNDRCDWLNVSRLYIERYHVCVNTKCTVIVKTTPVYRPILWGKKEKKLGRNNFRDDNVRWFETFLFHSDVMSTPYIVKLEKLYENCESDWRCFHWLTVCSLIFSATYINHFVVLSLLSRGMTCLQTCSWKISNTPLRCRLSYVNRYDELCSIFTLATLAIRGY